MRLNRARLYIANSRPIKLDRQATATLELPASSFKDFAAFLEQGTSDFSKALLAEESLVVLFGEEFRGEAVENLVAWGLKRGPIPILSASPISATTRTRAALPIWGFSRSTAGLRAGHCAGSFPRIS